ncbi:hypothetical protein EC951288_2777A, partial [Escherichia coli 95.1288]
MFPHIYLYI